MRCAISGCERPATGRFTWGLYPDGAHNDRVPLCRACAAEVWDTAKGAVAAGLMHFACEPATEKSEE